MVFQKGQKAWNAGLTKDTDERVSRYSRTIRSIYRDGLRPAGMGFEQGYDSWNKNLSADNDSRLSHVNQVFNYICKFCHKHVDVDWLVHLRSRHPRRMKSLTSVAGTESVSGGTHLCKYGCGLYILTLQTLPHLRDFHSKVFTEHEDFARANILDPIQNLLQWAEKHPIIAMRERIRAGRLGGNAVAESGQLLENLNKRGVSYHYGHYHRSIPENIYCRNLIYPNYDFRLIHPNVHIGRIEVDLGHRF